MKIVVIGGSGLIGKKVVSKLKDKGHDVIAASPSTGINALTGEGLADALKDASVVIDVSNSPSFEEAAVLKFFETSARNLAAAEQKAGVKHHIALSVVGTDLLADRGYFRGKQAQEKLIKAASIPYTIVQSTQFFEFLSSIVPSGDESQNPALPFGHVQPIASEDVAAILADVALASPLNGTVEIAGPERFPLYQLAQRYLEATGDSRKVSGDEKAQYFGYFLDENTLVPKGKARIGFIHFENWLQEQIQQKST